MNITDGYIRDAELARSDRIRAAVLARYLENRRNGLTPLEAIRECMQVANGLPLHEMWTDRYLGIIIQRALHHKHLENVWLTGHIPPRFGRTTFTNRPE